MAKQLVSDELWTIIEPLLPPEPPKPNGGRPHASYRAAFARIIYVLRSGVTWRMLPKEFGLRDHWWRFLHPPADANSPFPNDYLGDYFFADFCGVIDKLDPDPDEDLSTKSVE